MWRMALDPGLVGVGFPIPLPSPIPLLVRRFSSGRVLPRAGKIGNPGLEM